MATVTGITQAKATAIENASIVDGDVNGSGHLILTKHDGSTIDAGSVIGPAGANGVSGAIAVTALENVPAGTPAGTPVFLKA